MSPASAFPAGAFLIRLLVTVQTCGDLRAIRPLTEGQPSTEFALQADSVPSNVNSYLKRPRVDRAAPRAYRLLVQRV